VLAAATIYIVYYKKHGMNSIKDVRVLRCDFMSSVMCNDVSDEPAASVIGGNKSSGVPRNFSLGGGVQHIQLRTEDKVYGDLGAVAS